jgi:predicted TIM-barrel fold metal-dependent hydrolase
MMLEYYDGIGVAKSIMLPVVSPDSNYRCQSNDEIFEIHRRYPDRFIPFCNMDPRNMRNKPDAELEYVMKYYRDKGCRGVGEVTANMEMNDPRVHNLFRAAECAGLPVTIHLATRIGGMYGLVDDPGLPRLEEVLQKFPDLKIFGHSQPFWSEMSADLSPEERNGYP